MVRIENAIQRATDAGVLIVAAIGNQPWTAPVEFSAHPLVLGVADLSIEGGLAWSSRQGRIPGEVDIAVFGLQVPTTTKKSAGDDVFEGAGVGVRDYVAHMCGTFFAAPHVAAVAALIWSLRPSLTVAQVRQYLECGADDLERPAVFAAGRLNAYNSLLSVLYGSCLRPGDLDLDGDVTAADQDTLKEYLHGTGGTTPACLMDLNADSEIDEDGEKALDSYIRTGYPDLVIPVGCI